MCIAQCTIGRYQHQWKNKIIGQQSARRNISKGNEVLLRSRQWLRLVECITNEGVNKRNDTIKNQRHIDTRKYEDCALLLLLNLRSFGPDDSEKVELMIVAMKRHGIDRIMLSTLDRQ